MPNQISSISETTRQAIETAIHKLWYVEKDPQGHSFIELDGGGGSNDYLLATAYDHRDDPLCPPDGQFSKDSILYAIQDQIWESYMDSIWVAEDEVLRTAGLDPGSQEYDLAREWLQENYPFQPPYDHYLDQEMRVNILLSTPDEANEDHALIYEQFCAMAKPWELSDDDPASLQALLETDSSLTRLVTQQGHTMGELAETIRDYMIDFYGEDGPPEKYRDEKGKSLPYEKRLELFSAGRSRFLVSLCEELDNQSYCMGCLTVLSSMSMRTFAEMMEKGTKITLPADTVCGIFNPWNGSGSILGIELAKPITFQRKDIYDIQIEGVSPDYGYLLDSSYGLVHRAWQNKPMLTHPDGKPSLEEQLKKANACAPAVPFVSQNKDQQQERGEA